MSYLQSYDGKKVLVTGGGGSIGTNLVRALVKAGARLVIILDDFSAAYEWNIPSLPGVMVVRGSVDDDVSLKRVFNERVDLVYHLAAFFANQNSVDYPERDLMVNGMGTLKLLEYARLFVATIQIQPGAPLRDRFVLQAFRRANITEGFVRGRVSGKQLERLCQLRGGTIVLTCKEQKVAIMHIRSRKKRIELQGAFSLRDRLLETT